LDWKEEKGDLLCDSEEQEKRGGKSAKSNTNLRKIEEKGKVTKLLYFLVD